MDLMSKIRDRDKWNAWRRENIKKISFDLHMVNDKKIFDWLRSQPNTRQYLLELVKEDMKKKGA